MYKRSCQDHQIISRTFGSNRIKPKTSKMKMMIVVALALVAAVSAGPINSNNEVSVLRSDYNQSPDGAYQFDTELTDGSVRSETGELKTVNDEENKPHTVVVVRGFYTYLNEEGKPLTVNYVADEQGYRAEGEVIPKVPARR